MKIEKQIYAAARCDGIHPKSIFELNGVLRYIDDNVHKPLPDYTSDYNAMHRLLHGIDDSGLRRFWNHCAPIVGEWDWMFPRATCLQMLESYLKAKGVWVDETEGE